MAVRLRMKKLGRAHRPFFRICAMDSRSPRDGRVIEELGTYDPMIPETDARAKLNGERIDYWLSVGAKPTEKVGVLIKKYGTGGSHLEAQEKAVQRLIELRGQKSATPPPVAPKPAPQPEPEAAAEAEAPAEETPAEETPAEEAPAEEAPAEEAATEEASAEAAAEEAPAEEESQSEDKAEG